MNQVSTFDETAIHMPSLPTADTRLSGTRLIIARVVWIVLMLFFCGVYLAAVLVYAVQLHGFQEGVSAHLISTPAVVSGFDAFTSPYLLFTNSFTQLMLTLLSPCWIAVSLLIFWRRSDDWMALFVALFLVMLATSLSRALMALSYEVGFASPLGVCIAVRQMLTWSSVALFFALFPDGRFVPGWTRWVTPAYLACQLPFSVPSNWPFSMVRWPPLLFASVILGLTLPLVFAQLYRYRCVSTTSQRQQTKWIVFGMLVGALLGPRQPAASARVSLADASRVLLTFSTRSSAKSPFQSSFCSSRSPSASRCCATGCGTSMCLSTARWSTACSRPASSASTSWWWPCLARCSRQLGNLFISLLATGLVAVLFHPLRERLQQAVNRLMFGERDDPYRILSRLGSRLEATLTSAEVLPTIVETVAQALKLPYAAITWEQGAAILRTRSCRVLWKSGRAPGARACPARLPAGAGGGTVACAARACRGPDAC